MDKYHKRYSSIRCVPAQTTLLHAKAWADKAGISRVTNITHLDRIGLPVYASIRPRAQSDVVTYGKGLLPIDAQVGAYMEAIEFYFAEPATNAIETLWGCARDVIGGDKKHDAILDFNPLLKNKINLNAPLMLASAEDVESHQKCWIPAELVYHPIPIQIQQPLFGTSTNGLASGNSIVEASLHALTEVIERDIWSFEYINDAACEIKPNELPTLIRQKVEQASLSGLTFHIRYVPNHYKLPFFSAFLYETKKPNGKFFNGGWGCHHNKDIALTRAICEAAQSRLAALHGARILSAKPDAHVLSKIQNMLLKKRKIISYADIEDFQMSNSLQQQFNLLINRLRQVTDKPVCRVIYTPAQSPLHVVRILVPTLEHFQIHNKRMGQRFKKAIHAL